MTKSNPLERAFFLLDIVASANREMALIEIVQSSGLPQTSVFRLASNLVESGMLRFDARAKTYRVGARALRLSLMLTGQRKLDEVVEPALDALAEETGETSFFVLQTPEGNKLLKYTVPELGAQMFIHPGFSFPSHATAAGKVIAAFTSEDMQLDALRLEKFQPQTTTDPARLSEIFAEVRKLGYAVNDSELDMGVYSICAPVYYAGEIAGAIGFVGPRDRILVGGLDRLKGHAEILCEEADKLSRLLRPS